MKIIAIDPGVMTGYCYAQVLDDGRVNYYPFQMTDDVDDLYRRLQAFQPRHIIMEDFEYRGGKRQSGLNLFPVQLIGVARLYELVGSVNGQCALRLQKASTGKAYYTDTMLKSMGLYKRGVPHGMDASRHLLQWLTFGPGFQFINQQSNFATLLEKWTDD
jgi:hypothetical protein